MGTQTRARVLVVDDDPQIVRVLADICRDLGLEVATAGDGIEAMAALERGGVELVLLDLSMPRLDGFGVLERLREAALDPVPAVIIVTSMTDAAGKVRGTELGALDFVTKPFRVADLRRRIHRVLEISELEHKLVDAESVLWQMRSTDAVTGVGTFAQLYGALEGEFRWAKAAGKPLTCLALADERYGLGTREAEQQREGEQLQRVAHVLETVVGDAGRVFRVGAEELVILLPALGAVGVPPLVDRLLMALARDADASTASFAVGAATYPNEQIEQPAQLYRAVNVCLAQARAMQGRRVVTLPPPP